MTGIYDCPLSQQLYEFKKEIEKVFYNSKVSLKDFKNWFDALEALSSSVQQTSSDKKIVLFFDEFPWMVTHKSKLLQALDYYWNRFWVDNNRVKLIVCGSAASWIIKNILNSKGGLHNRITLKMNLAPFTLKETKEYLNYKNINFNNQQTLELYMCIGGIAFYLNFVHKSLSASQNINQLCFQRNGHLVSEFKNLFAALFSADAVHKDLVKYIAGKREGVSRAEIERYKKMKGGRVSIWLRELEESGFIMSFIPSGRERGVYYKVIDEYVLFYLHWIEKEPKNELYDSTIMTNYWESVYGLGRWWAWAGLAFESVCYKHIGVIQKVLNIPAGSTATTWRYSSNKKSAEKKGAQIDLLFDRRDGVINICEIKYSKDAYVIDKDYKIELLHKAKVYQDVTGSKKQVLFSMITSNMLKQNVYSDEIIASQMCLDDFFKIA